MIKSSSKCRITFEPAGISTEILPGETIYQVAQQNGVTLRSDCGGRGKCGCCKVITNSHKGLDPVTDNERRYLTHNEREQGYRLACESRITGSLRVVIPAESIDDNEAFGKTGISKTVDPVPSIARHVIKSIFGFESGKECTDYAQSLREICIKIGFSSRTITTDVLRGLSQHFGKNEDQTLVIHADQGLITILSGSRKQSTGIAFDIGTTTLAVYLCDLRSGELLASSSAANPQRTHGEDVISRIGYSSDKPGGTRQLQEMLLKELHALIADCLTKAENTELESIDEICVVGNTTMQQIFLGLNSQNLGSSPYLPISCDALDSSAAELGIKINPGSNVHVFPVISGFVGGDTVAAILADGTFDREEITLLIDVGTNGELVLGNREQLYTTSCATGPALEGAHISCGMRAVSGAIDTIVIDPVSYEPKYSVIGEGEGKPIGICGSGLVDAVAEMVKIGIIQPNGRLQEGIPRVKTDEKGIGREFIISESNESTGFRKISITLKDIRQVQLAKAALSAGIKMLMQHAGFDRFDRLVLTGAFGARFNWRNAVAIGMLPELTEGVRVEIMENGAGQGAISALINRQFRNKKDQIARDVIKVDLSADPDFINAFTWAINFPEQRIKN